MDHSNSKILGSIIKMNRIKQNMSQQGLAEGICVPSYLSRIENAEITASDEVIAHIFDALAIQYYDDPAFISRSTDEFSRFRDVLMMNNFEQSAALFRSIEKDQEKYMHSPLIISYYLCKLAFYCTRKERQAFEEARDLLGSVEDLMRQEEKFLYYYYLGVDTVLVEGAYEKGFSHFLQAQKYGENGHLYRMMGYTYGLQRNYLKAMEMLIRARDHYVTEGNLLSIMGIYELMGLTYAHTNQYYDALSYFTTGQQMALNSQQDYYQKAFHQHFTWCQYKLGQPISLDDLVPLDHPFVDLVLSTRRFVFLVAVETKEKAFVERTLQEFREGTPEHVFLNKLLDKASPEELRQDLEKIMKKMTYYNRELWKTYENWLQQLDVEERKYKEAYVRGRKSVQNPYVKERSLL